MQGDPNVSFFRLSKERGGILFDSECLLLFSQVQTVDPRPTLFKRSRETATHLMCLLVCLADVTLFSFFLCRFRLTVADAQHYSESGGMSVPKIRQTQTESIGFGMVRNHD